MNQTVRVALDDGHTFNISLDEAKRLRDMLLEVFPVESTPIKELESRVKRLEIVAMASGQIGCL